MGLPDEVAPKTDEPVGAPIMPGPILGDQPSSATLDDNIGSIYLIYYWRGRHDYLYFVINDQQKVEESAWYSALE
jgi:hypothetical protein